MGEPLGRGIYRENRVRSMGNPACGPGTVQCFALFIHGCDAFRRSCHLIKAAALETGVTTSWPKPHLPQAVSGELKQHFVSCRVWPPLAWAIPEAIFPTRPIRTSVPT